MPGSAAHGGEGDATARTVRPDESPAGRMTGLAEYGRTRSSFESIATDWTGWRNLSAGQAVRTPTKPAGIIPVMLLIISLGSFRGCWRALTVSVVVSGTQATTR